MLEPNSIEIDICRTQGDLYEWAADRSYIFPDFSDIYLRSSFCKRAMDAKYSRFQIREPEELMDFIVPENPELKTWENKKYFAGDVAYWIGYIYRYLAFETGRTSADLCDQFSFNRLCRCYTGLHTVDESMAVDILLGR